MRWWVLLLTACTGVTGAPGAAPDPGSDPDPGAEPTTCAGMLEQMGIEAAPAEAQMGVEDPVDVTVPIAGIVYRGDAGEGSVRETFFMDCSLAVALGRAAEVFAAHGVVEIGDYGVYNYRCIGEGTPPDCPSGISQHAYARAIDLAVLSTSDGTRYSVNDDWVIDPDSEDTCEAATSGAADAFLHQVVCDLKAAGVFHIILTPNYNDAHRNHWHADLTPDADFIE